MVSSPLPVLGIVLLFVAFGRKRKGSKKALELPPEGCELYPWLPDEVDAVAEELIRGDGLMDLEEVSLEVAREVYPRTPEDGPQQWPPGINDARAHCILDRIRIRVNLILAEVIDEEAGGEDCGPGEHWDPETGECVLPGLAGDDDGGAPPDGGFDVAPAETYEPYPEPGPVDLAEWEHPENYPTPSHFHQIGGPNSAGNLGDLAIMAIAQRYAMLTGDVEKALEVANKSKNWKAYRAIINCVPWNHAHFSSENIEGTPYYYKTPNGYHIVLFPRHDDVRAALAEGRPPERYADIQDPYAGPTRHHAYVWLPPLDDDALLAGEIKVKQDYWDTGDWMLQPPPEVVTWAWHYGIPGLPPDLDWWGCEEYETEEYEAA